MVTLGCTGRVAEREGPSGRAAAAAGGAGIGSPPLMLLEHSCWSPVIRARGWMNLSPSSTGRGPRFRATPRRAAHRSRAGVPSTTGCLRGGDHSLLRQVRCLHDAAARAFDGASNIANGRHQHLFDPQRPPDSDEASSADGSVRRGRVSPESHDAGRSAPQRFLQPVSLAGR